MGTEEWSRGKRKGIDTDDWMWGMDLGWMQGRHREINARDRGRKLDEGDGCPEVTVCWPCGLLARTSLGVERVPVSLRCAERTRGTRTRLTEWGTGWRGGHRAN